jgi:hypothetical protein
MDFFIGGVVAFLAAVGIVAVFGRRWDQLA